MSSKILKNCRKAILHLLKSIDYSEMPFDFDSLSIDGIDTIKVWYHKDYPYSNDVISKATIIFNNGAKMMIKQKMIDWDNFIINIVNSILFI